MGDQKHDTRAEQGLEEAGCSRTRAGYLIDDGKDRWIEGRIERRRRLALNPVAHAGRQAGGKGVVPALVGPRGCIKADHEDVPDKPDNECPGEQAPGAAESISGLCQNQYYLAQVLFLHKNMEGRPLYFRIDFSPDQ